MLRVVIGNNGGAYHEFSAVTCGNASPPVRIVSAPRASRFRQWQPIPELVCAASFGAL
jgi:hypothetical protein